MRVVDSKAPAEEIDYGVDWSAVLEAGDTITASTWSVPEGLTKGAEGLTGATTKVFLSGGELDRSYDVVNVIETSGGRTYQETIRLYVRAR